MMMIHWILITNLQRDCQKHIVTKLSGFLAMATDNLTWLFHLNVNYCKGFWQDEFPRANHSNLAANLVFQIKSGIHGINKFGFMAIS